MTFLILHGIGGHAGIHWQQWLHDELVKDGHTVVMPDLPDSGHPDRQTWLKTVKNIADSINPGELIIVSHSLGVPTALDYIEQADALLHGLASVSGFAVVLNSDLNDYFMKEKTIDFEKVRPNIRRSVVFYGDNDPYVPQTALKSLADELKAEPIVISKGGHLNSDAGFTKFPQLLDAVKSLI